MSDKSPEIELILSTMFPNRVRNGEVCATCGTDRVRPDDFKDDISRQEFAISYMCQFCQDNVFESEDLMEG